MMEKRVLYHGSTVVVEHPLVNVGRTDLDFGRGFYLTPYLEQAQRWAVRMKTLRKASQAVVNCYELSPWNDAKSRFFEAYDKEWLDFIVGSRAGRMPWEDFDVIEGGVADDRVIDAVEAYINGFADVEHTLAKLAYSKPNNQICILSQRLIDENLHFKYYKIL